MATAASTDRFKPAARVAGQKQDVWYVFKSPQKILSDTSFLRTIVNEAATASPVQPIINMGQGFL